jgi:hypothetical protein
MATNAYERYNREILLKQVQKTNTEKNNALEKCEKLQNKNYLLATALVVESIVLGLMIIF